MRKTLIIVFCVLLIFNVIYAIKYLDSIRQECVEYVKGDCFLRFNNGIVDEELDTVSIYNGFIKSTFINEFGMGCKNLDFKDSCRYLRYNIQIDSNRFNINGLIVPKDSIFYDNYKEIEQSNLWIVHTYSIKLKNCGKIIGYRIMRGDTVRLKYDNQLLLGDIKIDRKQNIFFKFFYFGLLLLNLIVLILIIKIRRRKE